LTLNEYFQRVKDQLTQGHFKVLVFQEEPSSNLSLHMEALNYLLYEWQEDHHDSRNIFDYVLKPYDCDWDFTSISFEEFFKFITQQKAKQNQMLNLVTKEVTGQKVKVETEKKPPKEKSSKEVKVNSKAAPISKINSEPELEVKEKVKSPSKSPSKSSSKVKPSYQPKEQEFIPDSNLGSMFDEDWDF
jgi:hypothetical protein